MAANKPSNFVRVAAMAALVSITAVIPSAAQPRPHQSRWKFRRFCF